VENIKTAASRQTLRFKNWMVTPKTAKGGFGQLFVGLMLMSVSVSMLEALVGYSSDTQTKELPVGQVQPSPVATPSPSPSPVQATIYDVTLQVNTEDGDRTLEPGNLEVDGDIYKVSIGRQNDIGYYEIVSVDRKWVFRSMMLRFAIY